MRKFVLKKTGSDRTSGKVVAGFALLAGALIAAPARANSLTLDPPSYPPSAVNAGLYIGDFDLTETNDSKSPATDGNPTIVDISSPGYGGMGPTTAVRPVPTLLTRLRPPSM